LVNYARPLTLIALCGLLAFGVAACGDEEQPSGGNASSQSDGGEDLSKLSGQIRIDGSSTVYPFAQAAAEQFQSQAPGVRVTVGQSGTGGGFEKFCAGETDISDASRPIDEEEEVPLCDKAGVKTSEIQVASDGIAIATNKNLQIDCMTTDQLKELWSTSKVKNYSQLDPKFPDQEASLFGAGTDSGTFDFFTEEINGEEGKTRKDYQPSEDDNVLVQGVSGDDGALGYFGFSYYEQNQDKLNLVGVDAGSGCVKPSLESVQSGEYKPLSRPIFMYPSAKAMERPEVKAFMTYVVDNYEQISEAASIVPMSPENQAESKQELEQLGAGGGGGETTP
jgi:phosphate transport system substrate-binding protein